MPEGDTIHGVAARLGPVLVDQPVLGIELPRLATTPPPAGVIVRSVEARGKHLLISFDDGHVLHTHLRMTGSWAVEPAGTRPRGVVVLSVPGAVAVCRRAPIVELLDEAAVRRHPSLRALGPDLTVPGVDVAEAVARLGRIAVAGTTIGDALLDQRPACGIGNVIMQEACFEQGIHPARPVELVDETVRTALYESSAAFLQANVHTLRRTTVPRGRPGDLFVYDRSRRPCRRCGTTIEHGRPLRDARPTYWCPTCQT